MQVALLDEGLGKGQVQRDPTRICLDGLQAPPPDADSAFDVAVAPIDPAEALIAAGVGGGGGDGPLAENRRP